MHNKKISRVINAIKEINRLTALEQTSFSIIGQKLSDSNDSIYYLEIFCAELLCLQDNDLERAVDWIFNHPDEISEEEMDQSSAAGPQYVDGPGST